MRATFILTGLLAAPAALACDAAICFVDPEDLPLTRIVTFEETQSSQGPGHPVNELLPIGGVVFGERFAGQMILAEGDFDQVSGTVLAPLTLVAGDKGQNLSVVFMQGNNVLNGYGPAGYPKRHAQGEGAMAFQFEEAQAALSFDLRGGEAGTAQALFYRDDGSLIAVLDLPPAGEHGYGFRRANGARDISGVLILNTDPQGLALDNLRFERPPELG